MILPKLLRNKIGKAFAHHGCWHHVRSPIVPPDVRKECFPENTPRATNEAGCGEDFLTFHRHMIRHFKWFAQHTVPPYQYRPWPRIPPWVVGLFDVYVPGYLHAALPQIERLVQEGTLDELGRFIEGTDNPAVPSVHTMMHGLIGSYEFSLFGSQPRSDMRYPATAAMNEHFWALHGWIDEFYASWQDINGEVVNQSPLQPHPPQELCPECKKAIKPGKPDTWLAFDEFREHR